MHLEFLTEKFLLKEHNFKSPVIVTGSGGCIGSWILSIFYRSGIPCVGIDLSNKKDRLELILGKEAAKIKWEKCDITNFSMLKDIIINYKPSAIIHLAGLQVPFCTADPALGARVNVEGTINIFQIAKEIKLKRIVYASSVAALAMPPKGPWKETLYGAYKLANEHTAYVYWADWDVPSIGIRPNIVYGLARDQGMSSKNTLAIQAAVLNKEYEIPFNGKYSWLYVGEAASAFISAISEDISDAKVFNLNGCCETIEYGISLLKQLKPSANVSYIDKPFPFPPDLDDSPLRTYVGDYPSTTVKEGIENTFKAFDILKSKGLCPPLPL